MYKTYLRSEVVQAMPMDLETVSDNNGHSLADPELENRPGYAVIDAEGNRRWWSKELFEKKHREVTMEEKMMFLASNWMEEVYWKCPNCAHTMGNTLWLQAFTTDKCPNCKKETLGNFIKEEKRCQE